MLQEREIATISPFEFSRLISLYNVDVVPQIFQILQVFLSNEIFFEILESKAYYYHSITLIP